MADLTRSAMKAGLRRDALARRDALDPHWRARASLAIAEHALRATELQRAQLVGAFWPIRSEVDTLPLIERLQSRGQSVALPVVTPSGLIFRLWRGGDPLVSRGFGLSEPGSDAQEVAPDLLLVPLAAFDRRGGRIGYGKGHYDRAIGTLSAGGPLPTLGLAFSAQEVASVPVEAHDRLLDMVATEIDLIRVG